MTREKLNRGRWRGRWSTTRRRLCVLVSAAAACATVTALPANALPANALSANATAVPTSPTVALTGPAASADLAITGDGDTTGYHLFVSSSTGGWVWRSLATIQPGGDEDERWIGQQCLTGDGSTVVAVIAPWSANNSETGMDVGGLAYAVNVRTGAVRPLASGVSLAYFDPGCGVTGQVALTSYLGTNQRPSRVSVLDAVTGRLVRSSTESDELTSAIPVGDKIMAVRGGQLVDITTGTAKVVTTLPGQLTDLRASADGGVDVLARSTAGRSTVWHWNATRGARQLGSGATSGLRLFAGAGGHNLLVGAGGVSGTDLTILPTIGGAGANGASSRGNVVLLAATGRSGTTAPPVTELVRATGRTVARPLPSAAGRRVDTLPAFAADASASTRSTSTHAMTATASDAVTGVPACAVPRNDIFKQVWQPTSDQVRWAVNQAALGALSSSYTTQARPPDNYLYTINDSSYTPLPTLYPSAAFPLQNLVPSASPAVTVPPLVMYGILAQESNWSQASWHAIPGRSGNPLVADYYGAGDSGSAVDYSGSDCGYGIAQVTDGMQQAGYPNTTTPPTSQQTAIAVDYATDIAAGEQILQNTWLQLKSMGIVMNNGDPTKIENWYAALWAYNSGVHTGPGPDGLGWFNNPANPIYPYNRHTFLHNGTVSTPEDASNPQDWPYQEKVFGWMEVPLTVNGDLDYRGTYDWDTGQGTFLNTPNAVFFCSTNVNNCDPTMIGSTAGPCPADDSSCWWNQPVSWVSDNCASSCITDTVTDAPNGNVYYDTPGDPEPAATALSATCDLGTNSGVTDGSGDLLPGTVIVDDMMLADQNPDQLTPNLMGCPASDPELVPPSTADTFELEDGSGNPIDGDSTPSSVAGIDLHQLGGGVGGHMFFTHTEPPSTSSAPSPYEVQGIWNARLPAAANYGTAYQIKAFVPDIGAGSGHATYLVGTSQFLGSQGGTMARTIDQSAYTNQWVSLGYYLCGGPDLGTSCSMSVTLSNITPTSDSTQGADLAYDAIAFVPVPTGGYVSLGDSFSSGEGVFTGFDDGTDVAQNEPGDNGDLCHRSSLSWPSLLAAAKSINLVQLACSGSNLNDLTGATYFLDETAEPVPGDPFRVLSTLNIHNDGSLQANVPANPSSSDNWISDAPNPEQAGSGFYDEPSYQVDLMRAMRPKLVTLTIGGNDLGFADILFTCVSHAPCQSFFTTSSGVDQIDRRIASLQPFLESAYAAIKSAAGTSNVYVLSYPSPIAYSSGDGGDSVDCSGIANSDRQWLVGKVSELAGVIKAAAAQAGVKYIDTSSVFNTHDVCADQPYANAPQLPFPIGATESSMDNWFHPNKFGYQAIEQAIVGQISTS